MRTKICDFLKKYLGLTIIMSGIVGAIFSWAVTWILPSPNVTAGNIPQKELTCTLGYFYPMITRKSSDNRLQLLYDEKPVNAPYVYGITVANTGAYPVTNEDFKDALTIDFEGSSQLVYAQVVKSSNGAKSSPNLCVKCIRQILETRKSALDWNEKWPRQGSYRQRQLP